MYDFYISDVKVNDLADLTYDENLDDVASSFSFSALHDYGITTNDKLNSFKICEKGKKNAFYCGYITTCEHTSDKNKWNYSGYDVGFYLNKNEVLIQFSNVNIGDAIEKLCSEYQISLKNKPEFKNKVSKIYKDALFSDILKELLQLESDKTGRKNLYIDCKSGNLNIKEYSIEQNLSAKITENFLVNSHETISNISVKNSIEELKNRVIYTDNNEKSTKKMIATDNDSVKCYGLLTQVESIDTSKNNNLQSLAKKKLKELNQVNSEMSLSLLCDYRVAKGKIIDLDVKEYGLNGLYVIISCRHAITSNKDVANISIKKYAG